MPTFKNQVWMEYKPCNEKIKKGSSILSSDWNKNGVLAQLRCDDFPVNLDDATVSGWPGKEFTVKTKDGTEYRFRRVER